ncbi:AAA family ATPase, partial [bacterium]|nr:AAA family ATPase [bacterium]
KHLNAIESDELFDKQIAKRKYVVSDIMPEGLLLLFGEPKTGKSFLVLDLCCSVAKGEPFLGYPTDKGEVLYFCYEDDEERLQRRLHDLCDEGFPGVFFSGDVFKLDDGLLGVISDFKRDHPDLKLVVLDTLTYIRSDSGSGNIYKRDYDELTPLQKFALENHVSVLLVHHRNKKDEGGYNSISGSNGIAGVCDDIYELIRPDRGKPDAKLVISGRDVCPVTIKMMQDGNGIWHTAEDAEHEEKHVDPIVVDVFLAVSWNAIVSGKYEYSPTELSQLIKEYFDHDVYPAQITKKLTVNHEDLRSLGLSFVSKRTRETRLLIFTKEDNYRCPDLSFGESGLCVSEIIFDDNPLPCDGSDGVTVENDIGQISETTVTPCEPESDISTAEQSETESIESENECSDNTTESVCDGTEGNISPCDFYCHTVTPSQSKSDIIPSADSGDDSDDEYDDEDEFTNDPEADKRLNDFLIALSESMIKRYAAMGITVPPFDPSKKVDDSAPEIGENVNPDVTDERNSHYE